MAKHDIQDHSIFVLISSKRPRVNQLNVRREYGVSIRLDIQEHMVQLGNLHVYVFFDNDENDVFTKDGRVRNFCQNSPSIGGITGAN